MKKTSVILVLLLFLFTSCTSFAYVRGDEATVSPSGKDTQLELSDADWEYLLSIWNGVPWRDGFVKICVEYEFDLAHGNHLEYCSEEGVFNDPVNNRKMKLSEEQKASINAMLQGENNITL